MVLPTRLIRAALLALALPAAVAAQTGAQVSFGGLKQDTTKPVEITADQLAVNQTDGTAIFTGNVIVVQGQMRLAAPRVKVDYDKAAQGKQGSVSRVLASGGVTFSDGTDAAEGKEALYTIDSGIVVMTGDVLLTQGQNAMAGQRLDINLKDGTGLMQGRVQTIYQPAQSTGGKP